MSSESLAALRKTVGPELAQLAEEHIQHDLYQSDREVLRSASSSLSTHATVGSALGLSLGLLLAVRLRRARAHAFRAVRAAEQPTAVRFASGREEPLPDLRPALRPSRVGDAAALVFFGAGGLFLGGETGVATGTLAANRTLGADPEAKKRIETAFRRFRVDVLKDKIHKLEAGEGDALNPSID